MPSQQTSTARKNDGKNDVSEASQAPHVTADVRRNTPCHTHVARSAQRQAHSQSPKERYRAAIRWFCQGEAEGVDLRPRPRLSPPTRPAGAKKSAVRRNNKHYHTPVRRSAGRQAHSQRARSDIAPLSGGFVKAAARECTYVLL